MKIVKIIALLLALALLVFSAYIAISFFGNPITLYMVNEAAEEYLAEKYPGRAFEVEEAIYNFKLANYTVRVRDPELVDCRFSLYYGTDGKLYSDTYDSDYEGGFNTSMRIDDAYRALVDAVLESDAFIYETSIAYSIVEFTRGTEWADSPEYAIPYSELVLNGEYDAKESGARAGTLVIYVITDDMSAEKMTEVLIGIRNAFDDAGVPFRAIDLTLVREDMGAHEGVSVLRFDYSDIRADDGMAERVSAAIAEAEAYNKMLDEEKEAEIGVK